MGSRRHARGNVNAEINVTPMADIMLVLLIIFMITTPLLQSGIAVNLPKAKNPLEAPKAGGKDAMVVTLDRFGKIYVAKRQLGEEDLYDTLGKKFPSGELNKVIYLRADTTLSYGRVVQIVNGCRRVGIDRIGLMADKEKE